MKMGKQDDLHAVDRAFPKKPGLNKNSTQIITIPEQKEQFWAFHFAYPRNRSSETSCEAMCGMSSKHNTLV